MADSTPTPTPDVPTDLRDRALEAPTAERMQLLLAADLVEKDQAGEIDLAAWPAALNFVRSFAEYEA